MQRVQEAIEEWNLAGAGEQDIGQQARDGYHECTGRDEVAQSTAGARGQ